MLFFKFSTLRKKMKQNNVEEQLHHEQHSRNFCSQAHTTKWITASILELLLRIAGSIES